MSTETLEHRIARLEARDEVAATIADYCTITDHIDALDALEDLFVDDAVMLNAVGTFEGRMAIGAYYRSVFDGSVTFSRHYTMNQVITITEPGVAQHRSYFISIQEREGDGRVILGRYDDTLVRTVAGWRFARKVNEISRTVPAADALGSGAVVPRVKGSER